MRYDRTAHERLLRERIDPQSWSNTHRTLDEPDRAALMREWDALRLDRETLRAALAVMVARPTENDVARAKALLEEMAEED